MLTLAYAYPSYDYYGEVEALRLKGTLYGAWDVY